MHKYLLVVLLCLPALAKAYHATRQEMIERSPFIAVVEIEKPQACKFKGRHWTYSLQARAHVVQKVKGDLSDWIQLVAQEDFECAQVTLTQGRCLVFLEREGDAYRGSNWGLSCLPIDSAEKVVWMSRPEFRQSDCKRPLQEVLAEMRPNH
jgi:hypothetical protein